MRDFIEKIIALAPPRYQKTVRQFMKFAVIGVIGTIVDYSIYNLLYVAASWTVVYEIGGFPIIGANLVSVPLAILSNFLFNKYWTFRDQSDEVLKQGVGYFGLNLFTFVLNQLLTGFFAFGVPALAELLPSDAWRSNIAKAIAIGIILFVNFLGSKFLIFRKTPARKN